MAAPDCLRNGAAVSFSLRLSVVRPVHCEGSDIVTLKRAQSVPLGLWTRSQGLSCLGSSLAIKKPYLRKRLEDGSVISETETSENHI